MFVCVCLSDTQELEEHLLRQHLSLPGVYVTPALASMSLGAAIATAAHGSSLIGPATITAFVTRAVMVDGTGTHSCDTHTHAHTHIHTRARSVTHDDTCSCSHGGWHRYAQL